MKETSIKTRIETGQTSYKDKIAARYEGDFH